MMKKLIVSFIILTIGFQAQIATAGISKRQENQAKRIEKGIQNGSLTEAEQAKLEKGQSNIKLRQENLQNAKEKMEADGELTKGEKMKLAKKRHGIKKAQDRQSKKISRKKHNKVK